MLKSEAREVVHCFSEIRAAHHSDCLEKKLQAAIEYYKRFC